MNARRAARIAELIREEASQIILYELRDPRIQSVTITKVDVSGDLHYAKVFFSVLGDEAQQRTVARGLDSARGLVQSRIGKTLGLRESPILSFEFDPSIAKSIEMSKLLDQITAERVAKEGPPPADAASPGGQEGEDGVPGPEGGEDVPGPKGGEDEVPPEELPDEEEDADDEETVWPPRKDDVGKGDDSDDDPDEDEDDDSDDLDDEEEEEEEK